MPLLHSALFWAAIAVFAMVGGFLLADALRQGRRPFQGGLPRMGRLLPSLEVVWAALPASLLVLLGFFAFRAL